MSRHLTCVLQHCTSSSRLRVVSAYECASITPLLRQYHRQIRPQSEASCTSRTRKTQPIRRQTINPQGRTYATRPKRQKQYPLPAELAEKQKQVQNLYDNLDYDPSPERKLPSERDVLEVLNSYMRIADDLVHQGGQFAEESPDSSSTATSTLFKSMNSGKLASQASAAVVDTMSQLSTQLLERPTVFLSASILRAYVELQSKLGRPQTLPDALDLYRFKASPRPSKKAPYYTLAPPWPKAPSSAVPIDVAETALSAAIAAHDMLLCLAVIETSHGAPPQMRAKILRTGTIPILGALAAPVAAYALANKFAAMQMAMSMEHAVVKGFIGIMTYFTSLSIIGYVAVTTSNDQMKRVTWVTGTPLWERWAREEERAAADRVAQAWGFTDPKKWGLEAGRDWEELREWCGLRTMILDKTELLPGME